MKSDFSTSDLADVARVILEETAFLFVDESLADLMEPFPVPVLEASMDLNGPRNGTIRVATTVGLATEMAANMLALEPDEEEARVHAETALGELLNILAGAVAASLFGVRQACSFGLPQVRQSQTPPDADGGALAIQFNAGAGQPFRVVLRLGSGEGGGAS
jgi:hypothetical protein